MASACGMRWKHVNSQDLYPEGSTTLNHAPSITLRSSDYPRGGGVVVQVLSTHSPAGGGAQAMTVQVTRFKQVGRIPACLRG